MKFYEKHTKLCKRLISTFIPVRNWRHRLGLALAQDNWSGVFFTLFGDRRRLRMDASARKLCSFRLAVCAIMKNEGPYLREWIEYHKLVGVDKFYLYDNDSSDDTKKILAPYIKSGLVEYTYFPGEKQQKPAYNDCIARHKMDAQWIAFIDLDEFMVPCQYENMLDLLDSMPERVSQVSIAWEIFGSNGHERKPRGLVIDSYTMRARDPWLCKSIVNPRMVFVADCHVHDVAWNTYNVPRHTARVNHYHCKSWAEYQKRAARGDAWNGTAHGRQRYQRDLFNCHDKNEVYDDAILRFAPAVRRALKK